MAEVEQASAGHEDEDEGAAVMQVRVINHLCGAVATSRLPAKGGRHR